MLPDVVIATVEGSETNIKITYPQDYLAADQLFRLRAQSWQPEAGAGSRRLTGHNYVVFGGSRGIGRAVADSLVEQGAQVVSVSRQSGFDIRQQSEVRQALGRAHQELGSIDGVVVTAGVLSTGALVSMSQHAVAEMIDTNLVGSALVAQEAHPYLSESRGTLVFFGSSSYTRGRGGYAIYSATKAAIVNLTQALADEWAADNIRVNCVSPARTATDMRQKSNLDDSDLLSSDQVAGATVALLCSDTTGTVLNVDRRTVARELAPWNDAAVARSARYLQA
jgi:NAD(P)-dependent dehydrogenase (short-subunit alcohol dehydrogenase family)